jgi:hypothetical protein
MYISPPFDAVGRRAGIYVTVEVDVITGFDSLGIQ